MTIATVARISPEILIDYAQVLLTDPTQDWARYEIPWAEGEWFLVLPTGALLLSWGDLHYPKLTVEIWSAPPPPLDGFERTAEREVFFPSRTARLESVMGEVSEPWSLPRERMRMWVSSRGKDAILAACADTSALPPRHIEEWVISFH